MKRVLLLLLAVITLLAAVPAVSVSFADGETNGEVSEKLPSSFTLVGTEHLPPISSQGNIGTCASSSITYMQFTNSVSRYLHSIDPDIEWNPSSGEAKYLFSPKYTYNFAGSGTEWVYRILMENGCLTWDKSYFDTDSSGGYNQDAKDGRGANKQSASWDVNEGQMTDALNYRLTNFEQIWLRTSNDSYGVNGGVQITTTDKGKALIEKVKDAVVKGNVVVTGGLSSVWTYERNAVQSGDLGKKGESVLFCGRGKPSGGHQVCIVGYDDNLLATVKNKDGGKTVMKGAFLMANSWSESYENDGYVWLMYDSLNQVSEYPELNFSDRTTPMDQFCFTYWDKDITVDMPELYLEIGVIAGNRHKLDMELLARPVGASGGERTYSPYVFEYTGHQGDFKESQDYKFTGDKADNTTAVGYFTFPLDRLYNGSYKTAGQFEYGVRVKTSDTQASVTVLSVTLKNSKGDVLGTLTVPNGKLETNKEQDFFVSAGKLVSSANLPKAGEGYEFVPTAGNTFFKEGSSYSFTINVTVEGKVPVVTLGGKTITPDDKGVYTINLTRDNDLAVELIDAPIVSEPAGSEKDGGNTTTVVIVVIAVVAVVVIGGVVAITVFGKKKKA